MIGWQQLYLFVKTAFRLSKGPRREQAAFFVAALCFSGGLALGKFAPDFIAGKWITGLRIGLLAIGGIAFIYGALRVWRLVNPPELPPAKDRPSAIKGPMAFTEADGELFRKLGREGELQKLLGLVLDNQVLMVVVRGASGAGKTSLLRAGLKHIVGARAIFHYWEAVPSEPDKGLLRAIQETWPEGTAKPVTFADLINPLDALGRQSHVIVLDQFEQLRGNEKIFQLLRRIIRESKPPHRTTWVIVFRPEFSNNWLDFISPEQENGFRPPKDVSLKLFTDEQAREVIGQLINESNLKNSIEQSVINNLVEAATVNAEVSPVDIGIGLLVLTELHERQSSETITKRDYQFAGGAEGLLTQYISRCLEPFPKESQEAILKAMLALCDPEDIRQRLATGLTIDELAVEAGMDVRVLKLQLSRLADRDIRLLEADTPTDGLAVRYRLPHERLIPALYRLTGKLLAEVDQAKLKFQNAFQAWQTNDKHSRYLLKGRELRLVQRYETQIPWGKDEQEKKSFIFRSKRRRQLVWAATVTVVLALIGAGWFSILQYQRFENRRYLTDSGYPAELYDDFQHQLKKLEMTEPLNLERLTWLSSDSIEDLSLRAAPSSNSIAGLSSLYHCRSMKTLTLDLSDSQVSDLEPLERLQGLTKLTLYLSGSQVTDLKSLTRLQGLTQLMLYLGDSKVVDLKPLVELRSLRQLTLDGIEGSSLAVLMPLSDLTQLKLRLVSFKVQDLEPLARLNKLTQLSLDFGIYQSITLEPLAQLSNLTQLSLGFDGGSKTTYYGLPVIDLGPLAQLRNLTELSLDLLPPARGNKLESLTQLTNLTQLTLSLGVSSSSVNDLRLLEQLPRLTQLTLRLTGSEVSDLKPLVQLNNLTQLTLTLSGSQVTDLKPLVQLSNLKELSLDLRDLPFRTLYLRDSSVRDLKVLQQLKELKLLALDLSLKRETDLNALTNLSNLTQISLELRKREATDFKFLEQLSGLTKLRVDFRGSEVTNLGQLAKLTNLINVALTFGTENGKGFESLHGRDSLVKDLAPIAQLTSLQTLSVDGTTRTQRMSLRKIPSRLVELRF